MQDFFDVTPSAANVQQGSDLSEVLKNNRTDYGPKEGDYRAPRRLYGGPWADTGQVYENGQWRNATKEEDAAQGVTQTSVNANKDRRLYPLDSADSAMARAIAKAMGGDTPDLDKTIEAARYGDDDDDEINLDEFDMTM